MKRRGFLAGILAAGVAPAAVGSSILMPVRRLAPVAPYVILLHPDPVVELMGELEMLPWKIWYDRRQMQRPIVWSLK